MDFLTSLINVGLLAALAVPGFILKKTKVLPDTAVNALVSVLLFVAQPVLTFASFLKKSYDSSLLINMLFVVIFAVLTQIVIMVIAIFAVKPFKDNYAKRAAVLSSYMGNCAFLGIPVLQAFFPSNPEPIMYCAIYSAVFNLLGWTVSVFILTNDRSFISVKKAVINPPTVALILVLPLFFFSVPVPAVVLTSLDYLGNMTAPLSMIILGIRIADIKIKEMLNSRVVWAATIIKLIVFPLLGFSVLLLLKSALSLSPLLINTLYIICAMPTAAMAVALCEKFTQSSSIAVKSMILTTILCIITIPLLMLLTVFV